jgi:hypothetical protein
MRARRGCAGLVAPALAGLAAACDSATPPVAADASAATARPWFREVAREAGVVFVHDSGHAEAFLAPESLCGGLALLDADEDGALDLYLVQSGSIPAPAVERPSNRLFLNRGDGSFRDATDGSGAADRGYGNGATTGDVDGDGHVDLYVTNLGANVLLRGAGDGTFSDVTEDRGAGDPGFGTSAAFLDADRDGDLDLYVANYLVWSLETEHECFNGLGQRDYCAPAQYNSPAVDLFYRNDGEGQLVDESAAVGLTAAFGTGLGVAAADFSGDGWPDVFVSNDGRPNQLWVNVGGERFEDRALWMGCAMDGDGKPKAGMGIAVGDVDDDGDIDLLVANLRGEADSFYRNDGEGFSDARAEWGQAPLSRTFTGFGTGWVDLDADGWLDQYQANGRVTTEAVHPDPSDPFAEPNLLYRGLGGGRFEEVRPRGGTDPLLLHASRGVAFGDLDGDGAVDVVVGNRDAAPYVLRNVAPERGHWLLVRVLDRNGSDAIGATVRVDLGERILRRDVLTAYSYFSASDPRVHLGLGSMTSLESLEVTWIDGSREAFPVGAVDRVVTVRQGGGTGLAGR